ncbi:Gfo/Idh/MocA family protein [Chondromyces crocatus]|uniref:Oxidoreductase n=1 Tax=Chondromyces crocatus TaxID=52 RepID=A0A0K1EEY3_CHOCO|nr:Gfo/Idh/MocA family oxidoreductase [Chondromyces crocatus]AKT39252.1 oxidoreductase [Chondromyces crocatus]
MTNRIGVGIIGANPDRGWAVTAHIPALKALPAYEVRAVSTTRRATADATARRFGIPHAFADHHALVEHPDVDLVVVSVKVPRHHELVTTALNAGKHVYCEWPLGNGLAEADALRALAHEKGVHHAVGLQARAAPVIRQIRDLIARGDLGQILSTSAVASGRRWGGDIDTAGAYLLDHRNGATLLSIPGGHFLDALCHCLGEFRELSATIATRRTEAILTDTSGTVPFDTPDQIALSGVLQSGTVASLHLRGGLSRGTNLLWEINGTEGDLVITGPSGHVQMVDLRLQIARGKDAPLVDLPIPQEHHATTAQVPSGSPFNVAQLYALLAEDILKGTHHAPNFDAAVTRHEMLDAIERAAQTGTRQQLSAAP